MKWRVIHQSKALRYFETDMSPWLMYFEYTGSILCKPRPHTKCRQWFTYLNAGNHQPLSSVADFYWTLWSMSRGSPHWLGYYISQVPVSAPNHKVEADLVQFYHLVYLSYTLWNKSSLNTIYRLCINSYDNTILPNATRLFHCMTSELVRFTWTLPSTCNISA